MYEMNTSLGVSNSSGVDGSGSHSDYMLTTIIVMTFLVIEGILVIAINAFVIFLICRFRFLKTATNLCLGSLALSDMLTGLYVIPLIVACNILPEYDLNVCLAMDLGQRFLAISTILHLLVITIERYHYIVSSRTTSPSKMSKKFAAGVFSFLWGFSVLVSFVQLFWTHEDEHTKSQFDVVYDLICLCLLVFLPLIVMAVAYGKIFMALKRQLEKIKRNVTNVSRKSSERHNRKERKAILIYTMMIVVYIVGWFNYFFQTFQQDFTIETSEIPMWAQLTLLYLKFSTGLLNPILYTFLKQDFKKARTSLKCCYRERNISNNSSNELTLTKSMSTFNFFNRKREREELVSGNC